MSDIRSGVVCNTCAIFIVNNDDSAASDDWNRDCVVNTMNLGHIIVEDSVGFSTEECSACCDTRPGERFDATVEFN